MWREIDEYGLSFRTKSFLVLLAGLLSSSYLSINAKNQTGSERTNTLVTSALAFSLTGILTSAVTYAIYNSMISKGYSSLCSSNGFISCADVIGDPSFNTLLSLPWGLIGISGFGLLLYLVLSIRMDPHARWVSNHLDYSWYASIVGMIIVGFLIIVELVFCRRRTPHMCLLHCRPSFNDRILSIRTQPSRTQGKRRLVNF